MINGLKNKPLSSRDDSISNSNQTRIQNKSIMKSKFNEIKSSIIVHARLDPESINNSIETKPATIEIVHSKSPAKVKKTETVFTRLPEIQSKYNKLDDLKQTDSRNNRDLELANPFGFKTHRTERNKHPFVKKIIIFESKPQPTNDPNNVLNSIENNKLANMKKILLPPKIQKLFEKKFTNPNNIFKKPTVAVNNQ